MQSFYGAPAKAYSGFDDFGDPAPLPLATNCSPDTKSIHHRDRASENLESAFHSSPLPLSQPMLATNNARQRPSPAMSFYSSASMQQHGLAPSRLPESSFASAPSSSVPVPVITQGQGQSMVPNNHPTDLRNLGFRQWLQSLDNNGRLLEYLAVVEENYDTVAQIVKTYVVSNGTGKKLDAQFFEDISALSSDHRNLFMRWFQDTCGVEGISGAREMDADPCLSRNCVEAPVQANHHRGDNGYSARHLVSENSATIPLRPPSTDTMAGKGDPLRSLPFIEWLRAMDPSGQLICYHQVLEDNYDSVSQIVKTYTLPTKGGKILDLQFFDDIGATATIHRRAFAGWFTQTCGLRVLGIDDIVYHEGRQDSSRAQQSTVQGSRSIEDSHHQDTLRAERLAPMDLRTVSFGRWLSEVDTSGSLAKYAEVFEENFDTVGQVVKTYTLHEHGGKSLDTQLFEDIGVDGEEHQRLFRDWFSRQ